MDSFSYPSTKELSTFLKSEKNKKILVLCGENSFKKSGAKKMFDNLISNQTIKYYFKKNFYPDLKELKEIIYFLKEFSPEIIVAIGGGSVLDYAKMANVLIDNKSLDKEIINSNYKLNKKSAKLITIPTTAGSGAEVTSNAVIYVDKVKFSIESDELKPDLFFLVPELVINASEKIKSSAGFDAIAQSLESLISKKSNEKSVEYAKKSLQISFKYFLDYLKNPNLNNTSAMCLAANLSGKAISISKTTAPHAVSYPFTSIYNVSHGHAVSLTLNKFLKYNYQNLKSASCKFDLEERFKIMFKVSNTTSIESFDQFLKDLLKKANLENNFTKLGIDIEKDFEKIISGVNILRLSNNPIELKKSDLKKIILNSK